MQPPTSSSLPSSGSAQVSRSSPASNQNACRKIGYLYSGECWDGSVSNASQRCSVYQDEARLPEVWNSATYPWRQEVRRQHHTDALWGTAYAQQQIWKHQHPADCTKVKGYLMIINQFSGAGSNLMGVAEGLGLAMASGFVLVHAPKGTMWTSAKYCNRRDLTNWACWLQPLSNCTVPKGMKPVVLKPGKRPLWLHWKRPKLHEIMDPDLEGTWTPESDAAENGSLRSKRFWPCSPLKPYANSAWEQVQLLTYLMRWKPSTRKYLDDMRRHRLRVLAAGSKKPEAVAELPPGSIAVHVRHSDQPEQYDFKLYVDRMEQLAAGNQGIPVLAQGTGEAAKNFSYPRDRFSQRNVFIMSDDHKVIKEAKQLAHAKVPWNVFFLEEPRHNKGSLIRQREEDKGELTLEILLNIEVALEAEAWVGAIDSNIDKLINSLRMTVGGKAAAPYISIMKCCVGEKNARPPQVCQVKRKRKCSW